MNTIHYFEANKKFYEWLLNHSNISQRSEYIINIEQEYPIPPPMVLTNEYETIGQFSAVDYNKAYTSI